MIGIYKITCKDNNQIYIGLFSNHMNNMSEYDV